MPAPFTPDRTRLAWIGLGVMGSSMCGRLMDAGYRVTVHNRTRAKAEPLVAARRRVGRHAARGGGRGRRGVLDRRLSRPTCAR